MKKFIMFCVFTTFILSISLVTNKAYASFVAEYQSYPEIIMETGKLSRDFTSEEYDSLLEPTKHIWMFGIDIKFANKNVRASYMSDVLYSYTNDSATDITYTLEIQKETKKTTSFQSSANLGGTVGGNFKKVKAEVTAKANIDYQSTEVQSEKITEKYQVTIEAHSNIIVYLDGHLLITNGVFSLYNFFFRTSGTFELAILQDQEIRVEKNSI